MTTATTPQTITQQLAAINKPDDKARSIIRAGLALQANCIPRPSTPVVPGATTGAPPVRPAFATSKGNATHFDAVAFTPTADGLGTNFKFELPYSAAVLAHGQDMRAALTQISPAALILKLLPGAVALTTAVDIVERYIYDLAMDLGATQSLKVNPTTGEASIVLIGSIAEPFADLLLDAAPGGGGGGNQ